MLNAREFADALRQGIHRSGLGEGRAPTEAGYVSLAGTILEYLKANLEVTVPSGVFQPMEPDAPKTPTRCEVR